MRIIITGSSGFIGFHLANNISKKNSVLGLDCHSKYYSVSLKKKRLSILRRNKKFLFKKINLNNINILRKVFKIYQPDIVFHLAGQPGVLYSFKNPKSYKINNVFATKNICQVAKEFNVKKFVFASSSSVYGDQKKFPIKENFKLNPKNPYAITKLRSEKTVIKNFKKKKIEFIIFRFFTVFGPFGRPDMFVHKLLNAIKKKNKIKLYNNGLNFRDFTYVDDVVKILKKSIQKKLNGEIINICRSNPIITNNLLKYVIKIYGNKKILIEKTGFVKGEMLKTHGSNQKLRKFLGKINFTDLKKGLKKTINIYKKLSM